MKAWKKKNNHYRKQQAKNGKTINRCSLKNGRFATVKAQIVGVITGKQVSIGNFIDNVLEEHLSTHNDVLSALYREEMQKGIFNQPKEKDV